MIEPETHDEKPAEAATVQRLVIWRALFWDAVFVISATTAAHYIYAAIWSHNFEAAADRTFFGAWAVLLFAWKSFRHFREPDNG